jgi:hypothetical protein
MSSFGRKNPESVVRNDPQSTVERNIAPTKRINEPVPFKRLNEADVFDLASQFIASNPNIYPELTPDGGLCNSFIGTSSSNWEQNMNSHSGYNSNESWESFNNSHHFISNKTFSSSSDILRYLESHPNFQRLPKSLWPVIVAGILSGLLIIVGGVLIVYSGGAATPGVVAAEQSILAAFLLPSVCLSVGITGMQYTLQNIDNFEWSEFGKACALSGGMTILTFGAGYGAGYLAGAALAGKVAISSFNLKVVQMAAGALAGSGTRVGTRLVISFIDGKAVTATELVMDGVVGAIEGGFAGFLAIRQFEVKHLTYLTELEQAAILRNVDRLNEAALNFGNAGLRYEEVIEFVENVFFRQGPDLNNFAIVFGDHSHGLLHTLIQHPDLMRYLGYADHATVVMALKNTVAAEQVAMRQAAIALIPKKDIAQMAGII